MPDARRASSLLYGGQIIITRRRTPAADAPGSTNRRHRWSGQQIKRVDVSVMRQELEEAQLQDRADRALTAQVP